MSAMGNGNDVGFSFVEKVGIVMVIFFGLNAWLLERVWTEEDFFKEAVIVLALNIVPAIGFLILAN